MSDEYIKIAGDHPSRDIEKVGETVSAPQKSTAQTVECSRKIGKMTAEKLFGSSEDFKNAVDPENSEMIFQKELLLSFTALACFENEITNTAVADSARRVLINEIAEINPVLYNGIKSSGGLSFYYLAFRRGIEVDRRMGQTYAMLCGHDGDPVYQELGETLYCWFYSEVLKIIEKYTKELD